MIGPGIPFDDRIAVEERIRDEEDTNAEEVLNKINEKMIVSVLDRGINPVLAEHNGGATLTKIENDVVFIKLFGGCQGCVHANKTITLGIKKWLMDRFPWVKDVVDATDHSSGTDPYFGSSFLE